MRTGEKEEQLNEEEEEEGNRTRWHVWHKKENERWIHRSSEADLSLEGNAEWKLSLSHTDTHIYRGQCRDRLRLYNLKERRLNAPRTGCFLLVLVLQCMT